MGISLFAPFPVRSLKEKKTRIKVTVENKLVCSQYLTFGKGEEG
jgi:hypothetical protein